MPGLHSGTARQPLVLLCHLTMIAAMDNHDSSGSKKDMPSWDGHRASFPAFAALFLMRLGEHYPKLLGLADGSYEVPAALTLAAQSWASIFECVLPPTHGLFSLKRAHARGGRWRCKGNPLGPCDATVNRPANTVNRPALSSNTTAAHHDHDAQRALKHARQAERCAEALHKTQLASSLGVAGRALSNAIKFARLPPPALPPPPPSSEEGCTLPHSVVCCQR